MGQILGSENQELLRLIIENKPKSLTELEEISGRKKSNLSRTLKTLERYGIVEFEREGKNIAPKVLATDFHVEFGIKSVA
jgi:predicted transcriptional regulator